MDIFIFSSDQSGFLLDPGKNLVHAMIKKKRLTKELSWISAAFSSRPRVENQANKGMLSKYMYIEGCPSDPFVFIFLSRGILRKVPNENFLF